MPVQDIYIESGYKDRQHYLECMSEDYGVDMITVQALSDMLGESEDFDGLISVLEDASNLI